MQTDVLVTELQKYGYDPPARTNNQGTSSPAQQQIPQYDHDSIENEQEPQYDGGNISIVMEEPIQANRAPSRSPSPPALESLGLSSIAMQLMKFEIADARRERYTYFL